MQARVVCWSVKLCERGIVNDSHFQKHWVKLCKLLPPLPPNKTKNQAKPKPNPTQPNPTQILNTKQSEAKKVQVQEGNFLHSDFF